MRRFGGAAGALVLMLALGGGGEATAQDTTAEESSLLDRHRPVLRYDANERYFAQPVDLAAAEREGDRVYGHVAREGGRTWLQYWLFYAYNPQDRGVLRTGRHEGDWEFLQVRLGPGGRPDLATLAQHTWAEGCEWSELERTRVGADEAPVVYVANGSHAVYSEAGTHDRPWPDPNDEADGDGRSVRPPLTAIDDGGPEWVSREERWGATEAGWIPGEESSPPGPKFQSDGRWAAPASFHEQRARPCGSAPPGRLWLTLTLAGVVLALVVILLLLWRGRSRRVRLGAGS